MVVVGLFQVSVVGFECGYATADARPQKRGWVEGQAWPTRCLLLPSFGPVDSIEV